MGKNKHAHLLGGKDIIMHNNVIFVSFSEKGFYFGDPCYVLKDADYNEWDKQLDYENGAVEINGLHWLVHETLYGDGEYNLSDGNKAGVDSGSLALVPLELCDPDELKGWQNLAHEGFNMALMIPKYGENGNFEGEICALLFKLNDQQMDHVRGMNSEQAILRWAYNHGSDLHMTEIVAYTGYEHEDEDGYDEDEPDECGDDFYGDWADDCD